MTIGKRRYFKKTKKLDDQTFKVGFFYKGGEDQYITIHKDIFVEAIEVDERILKKSEAADIITMYLKKPALINYKDAFLKKHRLVIEAMDSLLSQHKNPVNDQPILSFDNMDRYLGRKSGYSRSALKNTSRTRRDATASASSSTTEQCKEDLGGFR